jgi:Flp pilus assembly pilin Flp
MKPSQIILSLALLATTTQALPVDLSISNRAADVVRLDGGNTILSYYSSNESRLITEAVAAPAPDVSPLEYGRGLIAALAEEEAPDATAIEYGLIAAREAVAQEEPDATAIEYALSKSPIADRTPTAPFIIVRKFFSLSLFPLISSYFYLEYVS